MFMFDLEAMSQTPTYLTVLPWQLGVLAKGSEVERASRCRVLGASSLVPRFEASPRGGGGQARKVLRVEAVRWRLHLDVRFFTDPKGGHRLGGGRFMSTNHVCGVFSFENGPANNMVGVL